MREWGEMRGERCSFCASGVETRRLRSRKKTKADPSLSDRVNKPRDRLTKHLNFIFSDGRPIRLLWSAAIACCLALFAANLYLGDLNQDEGWYLYAARLVWQGKLPYVDFASTQGPVMPFAYALAQPLIGGLGVAGGRLFTAVLGFSVALCAAWLARRMVPSARRGVVGLMAFILAGINVYQCYFCAIVKTYALAGFFITGGFLLLSCGGARGRPWADLFAGVFLALAVGTRMSAIGAPAGAFAVLLLIGLCGRHPDSRLLVRQALVLALGATLTGAIIYLPFAIRAPAALWFALVEYHAGREMGSGLAALAYKAGFASRLGQAYFVAVAMALVAGVLFLARRSRRSAPAARSPILSCLWAAVGLVTAIHFLAPFPYDDYQVMIYPLFCAAVAATIAKSELWRDGTGVNTPEVAPLMGPHTLAMTVFLLCVAAAAASPMNLDWFVSRRDRIWWPLKKEFPLARLQRVGKRIRALPGAKPGAVLLTQDPYLAVETGMVLPRGLELGPFSYFPAWPEEKARARRVVNRAMMREILRTCEAPVAAFSGYGLAIRLPEVIRLPEEERRELWGLVTERYRPVGEVADFGQAATRLVILTR
ncbi:MAG: hypothetical protein QME60_02475 [Verrucomicrobiota bacterium]|nr:hypothetical protein [Verrucomicrobiota bacterium]